MNLRHPEGRPLVIGHRGAAAVAPENTLAGLEQRTPAEHPLVLDDALAYLAAQAIGVHIDLKHDGIESGVTAAVRRHGLGERVLVSSTSKHALRRLAEADPALMRAISYPHDRYGAARLPWPRAVVRASVACARPAMRLRLPPLLASARAQALSVRHELVGRSLVEVAHARGAAVLAWTVNDPEEVGRLAGDGVDAIVSDDPGMALRVVATLNSP